MSESKITTIFKGEFVQVDMVDETIELTVENNVYSYSESYELLDELQKACAVSRKATGTYSQQMQDELEPIEESPDSKANSGYTVVGGVVMQDWTFHTTDDDCEFEHE